MTIDGEEFERHLDVAAKWMLRWAFEARAEEEWENHPEWGQYDIDRIIGRASDLLPEDVTGEQFREADLFFTERAKGARP